MSLLETFIEHDLSQIQPDKLVGMVVPAAERLLKQAGAQDVDHDGSPDFQEAMEAAKKIEDGLVTFAKLAAAYKAKLLPGG